MKKEQEELVELINKLEFHPQKAKAMYKIVQEKELLFTPIRNGAWNPQQIFHHLADSHLNSYTRIKLALTEDKPTVKPYAEEKWAELPDVTNLPVEISLQILEGIHQRIVYLLRHQLKEKPETFDRKFHHPETGVLTVRSYVRSFVSHGNSHLNGIQKLVNETS